MHNKSKEKIMFTLPNSLMSEVDHIVKMENSNREDFAKAAFQFYITQKKKVDVKESTVVLLQRIYNSDSQIVLPSSFTMTHHI